VHEPHHHAKVADHGGAVHCLWLNVSGPSEQSPGGEVNGTDLPAARSRLGDIETVRLSQAAGTHVGEAGRSATVAAPFSHRYHNSYYTASQKNAPTLKRYSSKL